MDKNKPVKKIRYGGIVASIWENEGKGDRPFHSVSLERIYKDQEGQWKTRRSFSCADLPRAAKALDEAHAYLARSNEDE